MKTFIGIDVSKDKSSFCIFNLESKKMIVKEFTMNKKGFNRLLFYTKDLENPMYFMESTGIYHLTLLQFLLNNEQECYIINPVLIKNYIKSSSLRQTKTDIIDAKFITDFASHNFNILRKATYNNIDEIKSLARRREHLSKNVTRIKIQLKVDLSVSFPEILSIDVFSKGILHLLAEYPSPKSILSASYDELKSAIKAGSKGSCMNVTPVDIKGMARATVGIETFSYMVQDSALSLIAAIERLDRVTNILLELTKKTRSKELQILESIPGIGGITAAYFLAEIPNISCFSKYQKLIAFCGTDPGIYQSGTILRQGHITKHGNKYLRRCVYIMAFNSLKYCDSFQKYYYKKKNEGFSHRKAMVALMNKLLKIIYAVLTKGQIYLEPV